MKMHGLVFFFFFSHRRSYSGGLTSSGLGKSAKMQINIFNLEELESALQSDTHFIGIFRI